MATPEEPAEPAAAEHTAPDNTTEVSAAPATRAAPASLRAFLVYFLRLGTVGFGGPIVLTGHMEHDLVGERRWITPAEFKEGFALSQLAPGPLAAQLAMYLGWVRGGALGATLVGVAFIAPSFLMVLALAMLYVRFGGLPWIQGAFYGIGAAVIAIIAHSGVTLARRTVGRDRLLQLLFGASALVTAWTASEFFWLFVLAGVVAMLIRGRPRRGITPAAALLAWPTWLVAGLREPAMLTTLWTIFAFFTQAGLFVFGSGLAIVPFLHGGVVQHYHWLTERQFLDAVAVSLITPGPVVITVAFIGYLVAGPVGGVIAAFGVFVPVYLFVVLAAPSFHRFAGNPSVRAFVEGVTAAAAGAIAGAAIVLGRRALIDLPTILIGLVAFVALSLRKKLPEPILILLAGLVGFAISGRLHVHLVQRGAEPACELHRVVVRPEMHEEEPRSLGQHVAVQRRDLNAILPEHLDHGVHLARDEHEISGNGRPAAPGGLEVDPGCDAHRRRDLHAIHRDRLRTGHAHLVHTAAHRAGVTQGPRDAGRVQVDCRGPARCRRGHRRLARREPRANGRAERRRIAAGAHVHVHEARRLAQHVVVQRGDVDATRL